MSTVKFSGNIWWKTSILILCGADPTSTGSPLLPLVHSSQMYWESCKYLYRFLLPPFFSPQRTLWFVVSNGWASLQMGNAPWLASRKEYPRMLFVCLVLGHVWRAYVRTPPGYCMQNAPGAAHPQGNCCPLPAPIPLWYSDRRSGALLCSPLWLRGIAAFQGRKSAFVIFHFTECIFVGEFQNHTAEPRQSLKCYIQWVDVLLPLGLCGPWGVFHQLCMHFSITQ